MSEKKHKRPSISVSSRTYERLRGAVDRNVAGFVEDIMAGVLDDPTIRARVLAKCQAREGAEA